MNQYHSALLRVALPAICLVFIANSATLAQDGTTENESPLAAKDDSAGTGFFLGYLSGRPDSINYKLFTHICHAFVVADEDGRIVARASVPSKKLTTEAHQAKVKVILSLGGWGMDEEFAALTAKEEAYERFVTAVMKIVDEYDYDGIDLDWEFPDNPTEAKNFNRLARRFRRDLNALGKAKDRHFLLTMAVNASPGLSKWLDTQVLLENMDFINVMTYDFFGSWSKRAGHHTALFESSKAKGVSTQKAMTYWHQDKGIPKERLLVGLPLYSRGFAAAQPFDKVNRNAPRAYQALAYRDLQQLIQDGWKYAWDDETQNPWLTSPKGDYVHSYDNERSLALKTGWALQQGYRGVFFWEIKQDRLKDGSNPLLEASRKALDHEQSGSDAPYSPSKIITKLTWSPNVKKMKGYAHGDNWPIAWIDDGPQITAFCDGRGFTEQAPDLSLGFAEVFGDPPDFQAQNFKSTADTPVGWGSKGIKASDMIMVDGVLYMFVRNYQAPGSEDFTNARLACSKDLGRTWNWAPWHFSDTFGCPAFVQFGKNYTGARDAYVYIASQANDSAYGYSPDIVMARVKKDSVMDRGRYTFIAGYDENGRPRWSPDISRRVPIFTDPKGTQRIALTHNAGIDRYILTTSHLTTNKQATHTAALGVFEAPEPWGPWSTVYYDDHWSTAQGKDCRTYHHRFPPKWTSTDGKTMYLLYSGLDCDLYSFCVKQATLEVARGEALVFEPEAGVSGTFSIVAVDPENGMCGAAVASKYPAVGKVVPYVRAGVGAFCTQHWHNPEWGERALDMLAKDTLPEQVLAELLRDDPRQDKRQLAIIDMSGRAANRNPAQADPSGIWWGAASGKYYACQGNTLAGREVVFAMARAYEETKGSLADRLMASLLAGDRAGGDHRGRLAAGMRVAKEGVEGHWLELYVDKSDDAVIDLAKEYEALNHEEH